MSHVLLPFKFEWPMYKRYWSAVYSDGSCCYEPITTPYGTLVNIVFQRVIGTNMYAVDSDRARVYIPQYMADKALHIHKHARIRNRLVFKSKTSPGEVVSSDYVAEALKGLDVYVQPELQYYPGYPYILHMTESYHNTDMVNPKTGRKDQLYSMKYAQNNYSDNVSKYYNIPVYSLGKTNKFHISQHFGHDLYLTSTTVRGESAIKALNLIDDYLYCEAPVPMNKRLNSDDQNIDIINYFLRHRIVEEPKYNKKLLSESIVIPALIMNLATLANELDRIMAHVYADCLFGSKSSPVRKQETWQVQNTIASNIFTPRVKHGIVERHGRDIVGVEKIRNHLKKYFMNNHININNFLVPGPTYEFRQVSQAFYEFPVLYIKLMAIITALQDTIAKQNIRNPVWRANAESLIDDYLRVAKLVKTVSDELFIGSEVEAFFKDSDVYNLVFSPDADKNTSEYLASKLGYVHPAFYHIQHMRYQDISVAYQKFISKNIARHSELKEDFTSRSLNDIMIWVGEPFMDPWLLPTVVEWSSKYQRWSGILSDSSSLYNYLPALTVLEAGAKVASKLASWPLLKLAKLFTFMMDQSCSTQYTPHTYLAATLHDTPPFASEFPSAFLKSYNTQDYSTAVQGKDIYILGLGYAPDVNISVSKIPENKQTLNSLN